MNPFKEDKVFLFFLHFLCLRGSVLALLSLSSWRSLSMKSRGQKCTQRHTCTTTHIHLHTHTHFIQLSVVLLNLVYEHRTGSSKCFIYFTFHVLFYSTRQICLLSKWHVSLLSEVWTDSALVNNLEKQYLKWLH